MLCVLVGKCWSLRADINVCRPLSLPVWKPHILLLLPLEDLPVHSFNQPDLSPRSLAVVMYSHPAEEMGGSQTHCIPWPLPSLGSPGFQGSPVPITQMVITTGNPPAPTFIPMVLQPSLRVRIE